MQFEFFLLTYLVAIENVFLPSFFSPFVSERQVFPHRLFTIHASTIYHIDFAIGFQLFVDFTFNFLSWLLFIEIIGTFFLWIEAILNFMTWFLILVLIKRKRTVILTYFFVLVYFLSLFLRRFHTHLLFLLWTWWDLKSLSLLLFLRLIIIFLFQKFRIVYWNLNDRNNIFQLTFTELLLLKWSKFRIELNDSMLCGLIDYLLIEQYFTKTYLLLSSSFSQLNQVYWKWVVFSELNLWKLHRELFQIIWLRLTWYFVLILRIGVINWRIDKMRLWSLLLLSSHYIQNKFANLR